MNNENVADIKELGEIPAPWRNVYYPFIKGFKSVDV